MVRAAIAGRSHHPRAAAVTGLSETGLLDRLLDGPPARLGDLGVADDGSKSRVTESVRGQPGVAQLLLNERAERVAQAVRVEVGDAEPACHLRATCVQM